MARRLGDAVEKERVTRSKEEELAYDYSQQLFVRRMLFENFGEGEGEWEY